MPTPLRFSREQLLAAALDLVDESGPAALTVAGVARRTGAPSGSVYHRFPSRDVLVGELWLSVVEDFQARFFAVLAADGPVRAAASVLDWVEANPGRGRLLLLHRREDLMAVPWPALLRERAGRAATELDDGLRAGAEAAGVPVDVLRFAVTELPAVGCRPFLAGHGAIDDRRRHLTEVAVAAVLADAG